jgi:hypothetical protein
LIRYVSVNDKVRTSFNDNDDYDNN